MNAFLEETKEHLQYEVTQMRMIPAEHVFNRFPKLVRDLYRAQGKEVDFIVKGKEIELDRTVLDEIVDPIVHLLRKSVDHGIELPEVREEAGKERIGRITLAAKRETGYVAICVEDDGKGMDPGILRDKAISKGLLSADEVTKLSDDDAFELIFMPGFSTAESKTYAIPLVNVMEIISVSESDIKTIQGAKVITLRGSILPLVMLQSLFGLVSSDNNGGHNAKFVVVVVERSGGRIGLVVDCANAKPFYDGCSE